jgi:hypothetical protein
MRVLLLLAAISFPATAFAQSTPPKVGNKPLAQAKPKEPMGCKLVGTVKGTRLWAGDCVASELRGATPATETQSLLHPARNRRARAEGEGQISIAAFLRGVDLTVIGTTFQNRALF